MSEPTRQVHVVNIASGICFVAFGVLLLLQRAGTIEMRQIIELWPLVLVIVGAAVVWQASRGGSLSGSGACAGWLFWVVVLGFIFSHAYDRRTAAEAATAEGAVSVFAMVGADRETPDGGVFRGGSVTTVIGGSNLDLTRMTLGPGESAVLDVFVAMGGMEIRVPSHWRLDLQTTTIAAGINDERAGAPRNDADSSSRAASGAADEGGADEGARGPATVNLDGSPVTEAPRLVLAGTVVMGGINIK